ncbi:hypothetical protein K438DRAFT_1876459 [Mycena galopus ATCC 62051]|nr:hypothetical protein K438DRAFT_1876459 [Mycena galopus ATCC 62051]
MGSFHPVSASTSSASSPGGGCARPSSRGRAAASSTSPCGGGSPQSFIAAYISKGHRFDIIQHFGCRPTTYISLPAILLVWAPHLVVVGLTLGHSRTSSAPASASRATSRPGPSRTLCSSGRGTCAAWAWRYRRLSGPPSSTSPTCAPPSALRSALRAPGHLCTAASHT